MGVSGEDFPAFFPPTPVESARETRPSSFLLPGVECARSVWFISIRATWQGGESNAHKARFPNVFFGTSLRPDSAALAILVLLLFLIFVFLFLTLTVQPAQAQTYKVIYNFTGGTDGAIP